MQKKPVALTFHIVCKILVQAIPLLAQQYNVNIE